MKTKITSFITKIKHFLSGWNLLLFAAFGFIPGGIAMVFLTWHPTPGPYTIGKMYPYGGYLEAWQVSTGFAFVAFGILFVGAILARGGSKNRKLWFALLISFILLWFPHFWIGLTLFIDNPSFANFDIWLKYLPFIIIWKLITVLGFALTWKDTK